jgi:uncharacterized protein YfaS (alpha-2-macroglobulin family)
MLLVSLALLILAAPASARPKHLTYYENLSAETYLPGYDVRLSVAVYPSSNDSLPATVYRVPPEFVPDLDELYQSPSKLEDRLQPLASVTFTAASSHALEANLGHLVPGYYVFRLNRSNVGQMWTFCVSSFGLVRSTAESPIVTWPVDLTTFKTYRADLDVRLVEGKTTRTLKPQSDGTYVNEERTRDRGGYEIASAPDGSEQVVNFPALRERTVHYVTTDRPVYRPGQTVHFRAILRGGNPGTYTVPAGTTPVTISGCGHGLRQLYHRELAISRYGTVAANFTIPPEAPVGTYYITLGSDEDNERCYDGEFDVEAYKKPEATLQLAIDRPYVIAGSAAQVRLSTQYLFGRPGIGMHVHYLITSQRQWHIPYDPYADYAYDTDYGFHDAKIAENDLVADANGEGVISFLAPSTSQSREIDVRVEARDASGRTISTRLGMFNYPSAVLARAETADWFVDAGTQTNVMVHAEDHDKRPIAGQSCDLSIAQLHWNTRAKHYDAGDFDTHSLSTDASGRATFRWTPTVAGLYALDVRSTDEAGRVSYERTYSMVVDRTNGAAATGPKTLLLIPAKEVVGTHEPLRVLLVSPVAGRDALVTISDSRLRSAFVLHMTGSSSTFDVMPPTGDARFAIGATVADSRALNADAEITVRPPPHSMRVTIRPDKQRYRPGDLATIRVWTRAENGHPISSELSLGVVDEAVYALEDRAETPFDIFYNYWFFDGGLPSWNLQPIAYDPHGPIRTIANVSSRGAGIAGRGNSATSSNGIRRDFQDTAYWSPSVLTDARGRASVTFRWPDDLTTWRAQALAVTRNTDLGTARSDMLVTKDFLVRLESPRFLRFGDRTTVVGIAQGTLADRSVRLQLNVGDNALVDQHRTLDATASASAEWSISAPLVSTDLTLTLRGTDGHRNDAMQSTTPIEGATAPETIRAAGADSGSFRVTIPPDYEPGPLTVTVAPSVVAVLGTALSNLRIYPYDCTEQTLSAALPALYFNELLRRSDVASERQPDPTAIVRVALGRLSELQHPDGSFGWWEHDAPHPFMTAYAVYALSQIQKAGYFDDFWLDRAVTSLVSQLAATNDDTLRFWGGKQPDSEWNTRAYMLFALSQASPQAVPIGQLSEAATRARKLNSYAVAVLGLAAHTVGDDRDADKLLDELNRRAIDNSGFTSWSGQTWDYAWESDPLETTAYALRFEWTMNPKSPRVGRAAAFLIDKISSGWAVTTKDTAAIVYALSDVLPPQNEELSPHERVAIWIDHRLVRTISINTAELDAASSELVVPAEDLRDGSLVQIGRIGPGTIYWSGAYQRYAPADARSVADVSDNIETGTAQSNGISVQRTYRAEHPAPWRIGDAVGVDVTVKSDRDLQYLSIEDPFPAGFERAIDQGRMSDNAWNALRFLDDRATFFLSSLPANTPLSLHYTLRATNAGTYAAPPTTASEMYGPPVRTLGPAATLVVVP